MPATKLLPPRPVPPGLYEGEIILAELRSFPSRSCPANPDGLVLWVAVEILDQYGSPAHVVAANDWTEQHRVGPVFSAIGREVIVGNLPDPSVLIGETVRVLTKNFTPQVGRHAGVAKATVSSWIPRT